MFRAAYARLDTKRARLAHLIRCASLALKPRVYRKLLQKLLELLCALFGLVYDSLERLGVVDGEVGENLAVDLDVLLVDEADELAVGYALHTCGGVDTLNPQSAESLLFLLAIPVCVGLTLLPSVLGYGPDVLTTTEVTLGEFEDSFAPCAGSCVID